MPGVTAGIAASAYAGIPVTHRDDASAVAFVTGHEDPDKPESAIDWPALAAFPGTLVLYMGVKNLPRISERLIAAGRDPDEPAAAIERGTWPGQRTVVATAATLPGAVAEAGLRAPAILLFGPVAARRERIAWLERRPLHGRKVVVTRARAQASGAGRATLRGLGAEVVELPAIRIEPRIDIARGRGDGREPPLLRADLPDQPERRRAAARGDGRARPRRAARSPTRRSPRSARAPRGRCARSA